MPPKGKRKKIIWNNNDCNADSCLRPESTSTWVKCDSCKLWFHMVCVDISPDQLDEKRDWFCPKCHTLKTQEFKELKDKLLDKVEEISSSQPDFNSITISRDMFKLKKNAGAFNFATDFPPTLVDLIKRIRNKFSTLSEFRFEYKLMCKNLIFELLDNYASQVQFIEFELDDIFDDLTKPEAPEPEPDPDPVPDPCPSPSYSCSGGSDSLVSEFYGNSMLKVKQEKGCSSVLDLGVSSITASDTVEEKYSVTNDASLDDNTSTTPTETDNNVGLEDFSSCTYCFKGFTEAGIYSCKRDHHICVNCRMVIPGCICPVCYHEFGDRKRLALDHEANVKMRLGSKGANPNSKMFQVTMEKAQKGKGGRTRGSPAPATGETKPAKATKRKSSEVMADESSEGSGLGIGMVWSCQESSNETKAGILTSGQIKREKMTEELHTEPEEETPQINMTALLTDTQATNMLTMIHADVVAADFKTEPSTTADLSMSPSISAMLSSPSADSNITPSVQEEQSVQEGSAGSGKGKPKQAPKRGRTNDKMINMTDMKEQNYPSEQDKTPDEVLEIINGQINLRVREISKIQNHITKLKIAKYKDAYSEKVKIIRLEIKELSQLLTEQIKDVDVEPSVKQPRKQHPPPPPRVLQKPVATKQKPVATKPKPVILKSSTNATKTQFVKPLIIRPRTSSTDTNSLKGVSDHIPAEVSGRTRHPSAGSILPDLNHPTICLDSSISTSDYVQNAPIDPSINYMNTEDHQHGVGAGSGFQILQVESMANANEHQSLPETLDNQQSFPSSSHNQQRYATDQNTIYEHHGQLGQMQYIDMGQTNDDFEEVMPMVSMEDNNFVDMSSIDMGDLICEPVNLDPNALQVDNLNVPGLSVHGNHGGVSQEMQAQVDLQEGEGGQLVEVDASGGQLVEVDAGDGEVVEEDEEACCEIVNWIKNKHETSGSLRLPKNKTVSKTCIHWNPFHTVISHLGKGLYHFEVGRSANAFYLRAYANNMKHRWKLTLSGETKNMFLSGVFENKTETQAKVLVMFKENEVINYSIVISK